MFKIKANPTFDATVVIVGQGREQKLNLTYRHIPRSEYADMLKAMADEKMESEDAILKLVEKWDADGELNSETIKLLCDHQPGADWAIIVGYADAMTVARKGN